MEDAKRIAGARERIFASAKLLVLTGAGISAESGVPTFRGSGGLWKNFRAEDLATPEAFERDPALVWEWYGWRREVLGGLSPNPAHFALADMERRGRGFTLVTQNVDGLHALAGSVNILELHGNIWRTRCPGCGVVALERELDLSSLPYCGCGALLRPDIVWFGEALPEDILRGALMALDSADVMLVVGTSAVVEPAASMALRARASGAYVIEVNPEETPLTGAVDLSIRGMAGELLSRLL